MTHMRYWALTMAVGVCGAFIAIERFAFGSSTVAWITFGVAIAATVLSIGALSLALMRANRTFAGLSMLQILAGALTIIAMRVFGGGTLMWLAFAGGITLLALSLRSLAMHETTIERVVYALEPASSDGIGQEVEMGQPRPARAGVSASRLSGGPETRTVAAMLPWMRWMSHIAVALMGVLVVGLSFAFGATTLSHPSVRWIAFGIGIAAICASLGLLVERGLLHNRRGVNDGLRGRLASIGVTGVVAIVAAAMIVTMAIFAGETARWLAFALGCGLAGFSLLGLGVHELTSERVRHELELGTAPTTRAAPSGFASTSSAS